MKPTTRHRRAAVAFGAAIAGLVLLAGCTSGGSPEPGAVAPHQHWAPGGDGTKSEVAGYTLEDLTLPDQVGVPGRYLFRIHNYRKAYQTQYYLDQDKRMHVYLVRDDYAVFRHLHPHMSADGTWKGNVTVPEQGRYRLVAEFVAVDENSDGDQLTMADWGDIGGPTTNPQPVPGPSSTATAEGLQIKLTGTPKASPSQGDTTRPSFTIGVRQEDQPARLGTFLGVYAHVTGFQTINGTAIHTHPVGAHVDVDGWTQLQFHAQFLEPGDYRLFVQVRVSGLVRTVPITLRVS